MWNGFEHVNPGRNNAGTVRVGELKRQRFQEMDECSRRLKEVTGENSIFKSKTLYK